jgi:type IV pilus assembly protein PilF
MLGRRVATGLRGFLQAPLLLAFIALSAGCVTTTTGGFTADKDKEVEQRVDAANQYLLKGNVEAAMFHLHKAEEVNPESAAVHEALARAFTVTGDNKLADQNFRRAISIDPAYSRARNNYAAFLYAQGDLDGAVRQLEIVVADTAYESRASAWANLGNAYLRKGDAAKAEEALSRAVRMDRSQAPSLLELAVLQYGKNDYASAQKNYAQFRALGGKQSARSLLLGVRLARLAGDRDAEASYVLQLKSLYPDSDEFRQYQAMSPGM